VTGTTVEHNSWEVEVPMQRPEDVLIGIWGPCPGLDISPAALRVQLPPTEVAFRLYFFPVNHQLRGWNLGGGQAGTVGEIYSHDFLLHDGSLRGLQDPAVVLCKHHPHFQSGVPQSDCKEAGGVRLQDRLQPELFRHRNW
jgi:hypothetical protein